MSALLACIANFSEGRRAAVIGEIVHAIEDAAAVQLLGAEYDREYNRAVISFVGSPSAVSAAAFAGIACAATQIDMRRHSGLHPCIGAADVVPFVPLRELSLADCARLAEDLGKRVAADLGLPVFLYADAARHPSKRRLADIRRGGYPRLRHSLPRGLPPKPDFGLPRLGAAGACIIGARPPLIAFNVALQCSELAPAQHIARAIRASNGGIPAVQALGLLVRGAAHVSMNLRDYRRSSIPQVMAAIEREAQKLGIDLGTAEIVGLLPRAALSAADARAWNVRNYCPARILENQLGSISV